MDRKSFSINLGEKQRIILVHSLFSGWMLSLLFEGRMFYVLTDLYELPWLTVAFGSILATFFGLLLGGYFIKTIKMARSLYLISYPWFICFNLILLVQPSFLWPFLYYFSSLLAGACTASWGHFLKESVKPGERFKPIADLLIFSNIVMTCLNTITVYFSLQLGIVFSTLLLVSAFLLALRLPNKNKKVKSVSTESLSKEVDFRRLLMFLCFFIFLVTINSGLMYEVVIPAYAHLEKLVVWQWALPYIFILLIIRNLSLKANHSYLLYLAIAMIGLSFISFMVFPKTRFGFFLVNTLMLAACGIYDLFWWSILGDTLEFKENPAWILGLGLAANVLGIFFGASGGYLFSIQEKQTVDLLYFIALAIVFFTLALLPLLHKYSLAYLQKYVYLTSSPNGIKRGEVLTDSTLLTELTERELEVVSLLLQGRTYKMIATELFISENTVKYHIKNIYSKMNVQSRTQLIEKLQK